MVFIRPTISGGMPGMSSFSIVTFDCQRPGRTMLWSAPLSRTFWATSVGVAFFSSTVGDLLQAATSSADAATKSIDFMRNPPLIARHPIIGPPRQLGNGRFPTATSKAARASSRVESSVGSGDTSGVTSNGISVHTSAAPSQPSSRFSRPMIST